MADLKIKIDSQDNESNEKNLRLKKENANIFNEYSTLFEKKVKQPYNIYKNNY